MDKVEIYNVKRHFSYVCINYTITYTLQTKQIAFYFAGMKHESNENLLLLSQKQNKYRNVFRWSKYTLITKYTCAFDICWGYRSFFVFFCHTSTHCNRLLSIKTWTSSVNESFDFCTYSIVYRYLNNTTVRQF